MSELLINFASGVLTADPGSGGTTLNSGNFAFLPAVASPNTMRLVIDPDGLTGTPEVVIVTAHTASATSLTVSRGQETAYGAGAARAHAVDSVWRHSLTHASLAEIMVPAGTVRATIAATADPGYVLIDGSTVTGAQTLYPATWVVIPASWKSGANMVLPDWRGSMLIADDAGATFTLGGSGGANTHAITQVELPAVGITVDPPAIDPPSTFLSGGNVMAQTTGVGFDLGAFNTGGGVNNRYNPVAGSVDLAALDIAPFTSGNLGSGTAMSLLSAYGVVTFQLKVH